MTGCVVEIAEDGRHLARSHGFLTVSAQGAELGRVPLDDIAAVVASAHGITYSNNLLVALAERGAPLVVCGANHRPAAMLWSAESRRCSLAAWRSGTSRNDDRGQSEQHPSLAAWRSGASRNCASALPPRGVSLAAWRSGTSRNANGLHEAVE